MFQYISSLFLTPEGGIRVENFYLFIYALFKNSVSSLDYMESIGRMFSE
jgi:hypothetical protein